MNQKQQKCLVAAVAFGLVGAAAYAVTRRTGPVSMPAYTECRQGPLQEHLVTLEELGEAHAVTPHRYPSKVAPGVSQLVRVGFAPLWKLPDPEAAALPAESD